MQLKTTRLRTNLYAIIKNGLYTSKTGGLTFRSREHTQKYFKELILNPTVSESRNTGVTHKFHSQSILKLKNKNITS